MIYDTDQKESYQSPAATMSSTTDTDTKVSFVDHKGRPTSPSATGGWASALFVIGVEVAERFAYCGIGFNLITYLTGPLGQSTAVAAANVNLWTGASAMLPLVGGFVADAYVGRFRMIVFASLLYLVGLGLLTLFAGIQSLCLPESSTPCPLPSQYQVALFFCILYLLAVAQSGHKPCVQAFGADQFDGRDPSKSSFFNWWYFAMCFGVLLSQLMLSYIQDNVSWVLGFGIPGVAMAMALAVFLLGARRYRHYVPDRKRSDNRVAGGALPSVSKPLLCNRCDEPKFYQEDSQVVIKVVSYPWQETKISSRPPTPEEVESFDPFSLVRIWFTCLVYALVFSQPPTLFTKQGSTLDRRFNIGGTAIQIPPAALQSFMTLAVMASIPVYDRVIIPFARRSSGDPSGVTMLQRIGAGMFLSWVSLVVAALVEGKRLQAARDAGVVDLPPEEAVVPMSLWWLVPQYVMFGVSEVLAMVGLQEFFYDQMPKAMRSLGVGLYLSIFGVGNLLSGLLISVIDGVTAGSTGESWFSDNLNKAHLDYFYWLLAVLAAVGMLFYLHFASSYIYRRS